MPFRNDTKGRNHKHDFRPVKRVRHVLTEKCIYCPKTATKILGDASEERISALDEQIKQGKKGR